MNDLELQAILGHLTSSVGHQVINAFSTIVSQTEIVRATLGLGEGEADDFSERLETIIRTSLEASLMTRRLIEIGHDLTSVEESPPTRPATEVRLDQLAAELVNAEKSQIAPTFKWVLELNPVPPVRGRADSLRTMLRLLLQNAVESCSEPNATISLRSFVGPRSWPVLEIRDNGCGMPPEILDRASEPFFTTRPGHRGIGLTIARGICRRHRGSLSIESKPGQGTTIRISAPPAVVQPSVQPIACESTPNPAR